MVFQSAKWIQFAFSHQTLIIEGIFAMILAIIVLWLFINLNRENDRPTIQHTAGISPDLEATLKKLVENQKTSGPNTAPVPAAAISAVQAPKQTPPIAIFGSSAAAPPPPTIFSSPAAANSMIPMKEKDQAPAPVMQTTPKVSDGVVLGSMDAPVRPQGQAQSSDGEIQKVREELEAQKKRINDLLASLDQTREDLKKANEDLAKSGNSEELRARIAVLEARLQEYEVIEDDIANLSIYKKENEDLKRELNELKNGSASGPNPSWPINTNDASAMRPLMPVDMRKNEVVAEEAGAQEGEKLLQEFQKFMKGSNG
jgi:BMFP domain-containing protein YqiC